MKKMKYLLIAAMLSCNFVCAQSAEDTSALIREFSKVMSFTAQPYLYYSTTTKMSAEPVIESMDTLHVTGEFYKNNTEIYSSNKREEMYLQDSFMVEINNDRKTIWIRKVDVSTKENLNLLPLNTKEMLENFTKNYIIHKEKTAGGISRLNFEGRKPEYSTSATTTFISIEYSEKTWLPSLIEIVIEFKQPADEEMIEAIRAEGLDETKLVKTIAGVKQVWRKQVVRIDFTTIDHDKEKTAKIPSYKNKVDLDPNTMEFTGKGQYRDYEITKTF
jgi:hypothetical protein